MSRTPSKLKPLRLDNAGKIDICSDRYTRNLPHRRKTIGQNASPKALPKVHPDLTIYQKFAGADKLEKPEKVSGLRPSLLDVKLEKLGMRKPGDGTGRYRNT